MTRGEGKERRTTMAKRIVLLSVKTISDGKEKAWLQSRLEKKDATGRERLLRSRTGKIMKKNPYQGRKGSRAERNKKEGGYLKETESALFGRKGRH